MSSSCGRMLSEIWALSTPHAEGDLEDVVHAPPLGVHDGLHSPPQEAAPAEGDQASLELGVALLGRLPGEVTYVVLHEHVLEGHPVQELHLHVGLAIGGGGGDREELGLGLDIADLGEDRLPLECFPRAAAWPPSG
jgi:hypothetical protein